MNQFSERIEQAAELIRGYWRDCVYTHLSERRIPAGSAVIAQELEAPHYPVQRALLDLVGTGHLADVGYGDDGKPTYQVVEIGSCEWCGCVDHHLVGGECPGCRQRTQPGADRDQCQGCGCTDIHACIDDDGQPCFWVMPGVCSRCARKAGWDVDSLHKLLGPEADISHAIAGTARGELPR